MSNASIFAREAIHDRHYIMFKFYLTSCITYTYFVRIMLHGRTRCVAVGCSCCICRCRRPILLALAELRSSPVRSATQMR
eukprot:6205823-Pleurochrysis_carterae.AAC.3